MRLQHQPTLFVWAIVQQQPATTVADAQTNRQLAQQLLVKGLARLAPAPVPKVGEQEGQHHQRQARQQRVGLRA